MLKQSCKMFFMDPTLAEITIMIQNNYNFDENIENIGIKWGDWY